MYGIIISLAILVSALIAEKTVKKVGKKTDIMWEGLVWAIVGGIIGARMYHVLDYHHYYSQNWFAVLKIWEGGLGIFGAIMGGLIAIIIFLKKKKEKYFYWLDTAGLVMPLGQSIGRWANYFNQEIFGPPTKLPWGIYINPENRPEIFKNADKFHPLFLYESISSLTLFLVLLYLYKSDRIKTGSGKFLFLYLAGYSVIRFFLEFFRIQSWTYKTLNITQCISILILLVSVFFLLKKHDLSGI